MCRASELLIDPKLFKTAMSRFLSTVSTDQRSPSDATSITNFLNAELDKARSPGQSLTHLTQPHPDTFLQEFTMGIYDDEISDTEDFEADNDDDDDDGHGDAAEGAGPGPFTGFCLSYHCRIYCC